MADIHDFTFARFSHVGTREENQDHHCLLIDTDNQRMLVVVADGMGGHAGGALASRTIIDTVNELWEENSPSTDPEHFLNKIIDFSHSAVVEAGNASGLTPRSTIAALYVTPSNGNFQAISIHAGDCRITQYSDTAHIKQSIDHSLAQLHVLRGKISQEEMASHPDQNKVISNIGGDDTPDAEITLWNLAEGDRFVVCSDGFWEIFNTDDTLKLFTINNAKRLSGNAEDPILTLALERMFLKKMETLEKQDNTTAVLLNINTGKKAEGVALTRKRPIWPAVAAVAAVVFGIAIVLWGFLSGNEDSVQQASTPERSDVDQQNDTEIVSELPETNLEVPAPAATLAENTTQDTDSLVTASDSLNIETNGPSALPDGEGIPATDVDSPAQQSEEVSATEKDFDIDETVETGGDDDEEPSARMLEVLSLEVNIDVVDQDDLINKVGVLLRDSGMLTNTDELVVSQEGDINDNQVIRLQQTHEGIPVFGGEIITVEFEGTVTHITGSAASDIEVNTDPALSFAEAVLSLDQSLPESLEYDEPGSLVIFDSGSAYHLAWRGYISINGILEDLVIDAHDAQLLARYQTTTN